MKIRMDFVTNSSSSCFVCFGIIDTEIAALVKKMVSEGKAIDIAGSGELYGEEVCSSLRFEGDSVYTVHQIGGAFSPFTDSGLKIVWTDPYEDKYSKKAQKADEKRILKHPVNAKKSISMFFKEISEKEETELNKLVLKAAKDKRIGCRVFFSETDGGIPWDYDLELFFEILSNIKTDDNNKEAEDAGEDAKEWL